MIGSLRDSFLYHFKCYNVRYYVRAFMLDLSSVLSDNSVR